LRAYFCSVFFSLVLVLISGDCFERVIVQVPALEEVRRQPPPRPLSDQHWVFNSNHIEEIFFPYREKYILFDSNHIVYTIDIGTIDMNYTILMHYKLLCICGFNWLQLEMARRYLKISTARIVGGLDVMNGVPEVHRFPVPVLVPGKRGFSNSTVVPE
jgi:hypothetical protein